MNIDHQSTKGDRRKEDDRTFLFKDLIAKEHHRLDRATGHEAKHRTTLIAPPGRADEPWVNFTDRDLFGVALSGGGIRSATFNLGLLQALERKHLLKTVDYLSTVSGGGYIGGFWTAWRIRPGAPPHEERPFPAQAAQNPSAGLPDTREQPEIRHLREFSRFLMPRLGFFHMETWTGIVAILGGLLPSLTAAVSVLALLHYTWFYLGYALIATNPLWSWIYLGAIIAAYQLGGEFLWRRSGKDGDARQPILIYLLFAFTATALAGVFWLYWRSIWMVDSMERWLQQVQAVWQSGAGHTYPVDTGFDAVLFGPALVAALAGAVLLVGRAISSRMVLDRHDAIRWSSGFDRAAARCLAPAVMWAGLALTWETCHWLLHQDWRFAATTGSTATFAFLFVWLRDWLTKPTEENLASTVIGRVAEKLKPLVPQLLAIGFVFSMLVAVGVMVQAYGLGWPIRVALGAGTALIFIGGTLLFFDPARVGMHDFYRSRICRCFLGAARAAGQSNRHPTSEQFGDDHTMEELRERAPDQRPIHLVCCAANNLAGDTLGSLYRGARSAVISPFGISLGNNAAACDDLRFSSALTASAAAFNSQMGRLSMDLGPAVAFVMSAFNLRLGLWVPHPLMVNPRPPSLVGRPFFYEMFGLTKCDPIRSADGDPARPSLVKKCLDHIDPLAASLQQVTQSATRSMVYKVASAKLADAVAETVGSLAKDRLHDVQFLHLSDGGHFENLGLYELVRRHCRYLIVSDCGADPEVAFDDLAIAVRTIREDFGVEIELDVTPLRAGESGRARQHAVVGTVHYDGFGGTDKGTILLFKPTVTGDEPSDILQYKARNPAFPHESTGDQFYDEAQWESYRRLGEHAGDAIFRQLDPVSGSQSGDSQFVENVFLEATQRWFPAVERQTETFLALTERCSAVETAICENAPVRLRAEFFPEVAAALSPATAQAPAAAAARSAAMDDEVRIVYYVMFVAQVMEDAWLAADLEDRWSHPLNEGWMNYFQRWASTPSFRRWWPVLRPIYNVRFRDFVRDRFGIRTTDGVARDEPTDAGATLELQSLARVDQVKDGLAWAHWEQRHGPTELRGMHGFNYQLTLNPVPPGLQRQSFQAGFLLYRSGHDQGDEFVQWNVEELFVPHSLNGAGIVARLLDAVIAHFRKKHEDGTGPGELRVLLVASRAGERNSRRDPGHRLQRVHLINFYKSRGFIIAAPGSGDADPRMLRLQFAPSRSAPPHVAGRPHVIS